MSGPLANQHRTNDIIILSVAVISKLVCRPINYQCDDETHQHNSHTLLQQLHWLPIEYSINFKFANVTFNTLHYSQPAYLHFILCFHAPVRSLSSSDTNLLTVAVTRTALGAHSFSVTSHKISNSLPTALHSCNCPDTFTGTSRLITSSKTFHHHRSKLDKAPLTGAQRRRTDIKP